MIRIFGKWLGINIEINDVCAEFGIGLWNYFYILIDWTCPTDFKIFKTTHARTLYWKYFEIGVVA